MKNCAKLEKKMKSRFTLIELLVVIAIIAILASLLLPALSAVKDEAKNLQCKSNLRQLANLTLSYSDDSVGYLPYASYCDPSTGKWRSWADYLLSVMDVPKPNPALGPVNSIFYCPIATGLHWNNWDLKNYGLSLTVGGLKVSSVSQTKLMIADGHWSDSDGCYQNHTTAWSTTGTPDLMHKFGYNSAMMDSHVIWQKNYDMTQW